MQAGVVGTTILMYTDDTTIYFNFENLSGINVDENVSNELNKVTTGYQ